MAAPKTPPGIVRPYAGATAPAGYLLCDGASYLRADYAMLFAEIGTTYGAADGTHFNVPDCKGKIIFGYDATDSDFNAMGKTGGAKSANLAHSHTCNNHTHTGSGASSASSNGGIGKSNDTNFANPSHTHTVTVTTGVQTNTGTDSQLSATQSIMMPYLTFNWIIKT